ncbi:hypothetical protein QB607_003002 [Clostridium botulinum]|nr:hypothetical protein [Clostridium botulinum]EKS4395676.1 hypothetical protein [Clostridium botulinum]
MSKTRGKRAELILYEDSATYNKESYIVHNSQKQYKTWEIIKMIQENQLNNENIIVGSNFKEKVFDIRKENLGVDDLLISEPFIIKKYINRDVNILYNKIKILTKEDTLSYLKDIVENHLDIKTIADLNKVLENKKDKSYNNELDWLNC